MKELIHGLAQNMRNTKGELERGRVFFRFNRNNRLPRSPDAARKLRLGEVCAREPDAFDLVRDPRFLSAHDLSPISVDHDRVFYEVGHIAHDQQPEDNLCWFFKADARRIVRADTRV